MDYSKKKQPNKEDFTEKERDCVKPLLAHAYVPWQRYTKYFSPQEAFKKGTLFPELYGVYKIPQ